MTIPLEVTNAYREAAIRGASQIELVILMYDMIVEDLNRAIDAIRDNDIEKRTAETKHALSVLGQLQASLNMADGGEAARYMDRLYSTTKAKLVEASIKNSVVILQKLRFIYSDLKSAWQQAEPSAAPVTNMLSPLPAPSSFATDSTDTPHEWSI